MTGGYLARLRAHIGPRKVIVCYATALIRDARGQLLFQQRGDFDWWGLPGGVLELGETLAEGCIREAREETGLTVEPLKLVGVYTGPQYDVRYPNGDEVQQWTAAFECRIVGGALRADGAEAHAQAFFPPETLPATSRWYADMARDLFAEREAAFFESPRAEKTGGDGDGLMALRPLVGQTELIAPGAGAFIRDERGRILLIKRADNGQWSVPGGMTDLGECAAETMVRETFEETGLLVAPIRLIGAYSGPEYRIVYPNGDRMQICSAVFECRLLGGEPLADGVETSEVRYFSLDDLPTPMPPRVVKRIAEARLGRSHAHFQ